jgi:hypothetical protein
VIKVHVRRTFGAVLMLAGAAAGCSGAEPGPDGQPGLPGEEDFEFAPHSEPTSDKQARADELSAKGSSNVSYGPAYTIPVTIAPGQTVTYSTSGGTDTQDPVLVLFRRHDNSTNFGSPYTQRPGLQTLAINDDISPPARDSSIIYQNLSGTTENARLMLFAYGSNVGEVTLAGSGLSAAVVSFDAGSTKASGTAGVAWTSGSTGGGDPWLFMFDDIPGQGNGAWNDDDPAGGTYESRIAGATGAYMWYVAHQYSTSTGSTTINY